MCQGLEVEGLRYETGVIRVWFGYDSRSTIQHTVSDLDRSYNGQSAQEAGRCKRYRLPQWSYSGQCRDPWSPNNNHQQAFKNDLHFWGFASGYASGLCFGVCFGGMLRKSATFHQYISRTTEKNTNPFIYLQAWKRSYSARLPQLDNILTTSIFELDNIKNETILRDFLPSFFEVDNIKKRSNSARLPSKMESWVLSWRPRTNAFCDFSTPPV